VASDFELGDVVFEIAKVDLARDLLKSADLELD